MAGKPFDATLKDLIEASPRQWAERFCHRPVIDADLIDSDLATVSAAADKVLRVRQDIGDCIVDIEPESSHAAALPGQLLFYSTLLKHRHGLPVRSVLLLLRSEANATEVTGLLERRHAPGEAPYKTFRYEVVRVWQLTAESLLTGPLAFVPLANEAAADLTGTVRQAVTRIRADAAPDRVGTMEASLFVLLGLRYEGDIIEGLAAEVREMEESSTYQWIVRKSARQELVETLLDLGGQRFGAPEPAIVAAIQAITDLGRLRHMRSYLLAAESWDGLLSTP